MASNAKDWAKAPSRTHSDPGELAKYLAALQAQADAEKAKDPSAARKASAKASSIFFVMSPGDQTIASRAAKAKGLL